MAGTGYGTMLAPQNPLGTPPPVAMPPQAKAMPGGAMTPSPTPMPGPTPGMPAAGAGMPPAQVSEEAKLAAYNAHQENFLKALATDYAMGRISKEDLKKGAAYTGVQPYHAWKKDNVTHLKAIADAQGQ